MLSSNCQKFEVFHNQKHTLIILHNSFIKYIWLGVGGKMFRYSSCKIFCYFFEHSYWSLWKIQRKMPKDLLHELCLFLLLPWRLVLLVVHNNFSTHTRKIWYELTTLWVWLNKWQHFFWHRGFLFPELILDISKTPIIACCWSTSPKSQNNEYQK